MASLWDVLIPGHFVITARRTHSRLAGRLAADWQATGPACTPPPAAWHLLLATQRPTARPQVACWPAGHLLRMITFMQGTSKQRTQIVRNKKLQDIVAGYITPGKMTAEYIMAGYIMAGYILWQGILRQGILRQGLLQQGILRQGILRLDIFRQGIFWQCILRHVENGKGHISKLYDGNHFCTFDYRVRKLSARSTTCIPLAWSKHIIC